MFGDMKSTIDDFVDLVIPELQRRGLFRLDYEGNTLREHLGFERPQNSFVARKAAGGAPAPTFRAVASALSTTAPDRA